MLLANSRDGNGRLKLGGKVIREHCLSRQIKDDSYVQRQRLRIKKSIYFTIYTPFGEKPLKVYPCSVKVSQQSMQMFLMDVTYSSKVQYICRGRNTVLFPRPA